MSYLGIALFLIGALAELRDYLVGAWPTSLTWILMGSGLLLVAVDLTRAHSRWRYVALAALTLFVLGIAGAWLLG
jgi:predicted Na+-dependent transporter